MKSPEQLQDDIQQTRQQVGQDLDAIAERFTPSHIKERAVERMNVMARDVADKARARTREVGMSVVRTIRENPIPSAMIGAGIAWLLIERRSGDEMTEETYYPDTEPVAEGRMHRLASGVSDRASTVASETREKFAQLSEETRERAAQLKEGARDKVEQARERAGEIGTRAKDRLEDLKYRAQDRARQVGDTTRVQARRVASGAQNMYEDNPIAVASAVILLGVAVGMLLPATRREDRLVGGVRDELLGRAKDVARTTARELKENVRDESSNVKAALESAAREVKEAAGRAAERTGEAAKSEVQRQSQT